MKCSILLLKLNKTIKFEFELFLKSLQEIRVNVHSYLRISNVVNKPCIVWPFWRLDLEMDLGAGMGKTSKQAAAYDISQKKQEQNQWFGRPSPLLQRVHNTCVNMLHKISHRCTLYHSRFIRKPQKVVLPQHILHLSW